MNKKETNIWKAVALIAIAMLAVVGVLYVNNIGLNKPVEEESVPEEEISYLSLWNDDAKAKIELEKYIKEVTDETNPSYIPEENRIAVFDLDGTLFCETDPVYFDHMLFMHRVQDDPTHEASEFELEVAEKVQEFIDTGNYPEGLDNLHGQGVASAFAGMTVKEFNDYIYEYRQTPCPGYENMTIGNAFYLPMLEILDMLQANGFKTYIVSGTDRLIVRGVVDGLSFMNIPANQIIGSDELLVSSNQGDTDGLDYVFTDDDELILAGQFLIKNLKMNKVTVIAQEIGVQPVLAFGNSSGDASMTRYTVTNNPYPSMAFMLCCDDTVRENGDEAKAEKMFKTCEENGWIPISMKNDWVTIYGEEVTRK
ncbi:MAG: haloacid dehalogenase-like hydrolase [Erysipelotrichaceae bacterium]|nr:haloacid dehalogenase-like hydrolase [Erysipelotrichaceae bacterium]